jgi:hypothetical protein
MYSLLMRGVQTLHPPGAGAAPGGVQSTTEKVSSVAPEPSVEPLEEKTTPNPFQGDDQKILLERAERARRGSKRKRDVQALREVHPKPDWYAWAAEHLPSLPADLVVIAAGIERRRGATGAELDAAAVRRRVIDQYPHLEEAA